MAKPRFSLGFLLLVPSILIAMLCITVGAKRPREVTVSVPVAEPTADGRYVPKVMTQKRNVDFAGWPFPYLMSEAVPVSVSWLYVSLDVLVGISLTAVLVAVGKLASVFFSIQRASAAPRVSAE